MDGCKILHHKKDGWNPIDNGINHLSTGAGFFQSTVGSVKLLAYSQPIHPSHWQILRLKPMVTWGTPILENLLNDGFEFQFARFSTSVRYAWGCLNIRNIVSSCFTPGFQAYFLSRVFQKPENSNWSHILGDIPWISHGFLGISPLKIGALIGLSMGEIICHGGLGIDIYVRFVAG